MPRLVSIQLLVEDGQPLPTNVYLGGLAQLGVYSATVNLHEDEERLVGLHDSVVSVTTVPFTSFSPVRR